MLTLTRPPRIRPWWLLPEMVAIELSLAFVAGVFSGIVLGKFWP